MATVQFGWQGPKVAAPTGASLLAVAAGAGVPLAQSCRGRGVCNACRVAVESGADGLSEPSPFELRWKLPPGWRLACQARIRESATPALEIRLWSSAWGSRGSTIAEHGASP